MKIPGRAARGEAVALGKRLPQARDEQFRREVFPSPLESAHPRRGERGTSLTDSENPPGRGTTSARFTQCTVAVLAGLSAQLDA